MVHRTMECKAAVVSCSTFVGSDQRPSVPVVRFWHLTGIEAAAGNVRFGAEPEITAPHSNVCKVPKADNSQVRMDLRERFWIAPGK